MFSASPLLCIITSQALIWVSSCYSNLIVKGKNVLGLEIDEQEVELEDLL